MPSVRIPRTCQSRNVLTYAKLLLRVYPERRINAYEGKLLKPGAVIDETDLWPSAEYPAIPLLLEYAGTDGSKRDGSKRGHNRAHDIYVLWRYDQARGEWMELIRAVSEGADWIEHLKPIALAELGRAKTPADANAAACVTCRVLQALDHELEMLGPGDRHLVMAFVYQEFSVRAVAFA